MQPTVRPEQTPSARARAFAALRRWGPALAVAALIFLLSAQPGLRVSNDRSVDLPIRHLAHVAVYGLLAAAMLRAVAWERPVGWRALIVAIAAATLYGVSDEVHQAFVPDRTGTVVDVGWDLLGAILGALAYAAAERVRRRRQRLRGLTKDGPQASLRQRGSAIKAER